MGDKINAGIYCINPSVLSRIEMRPTSIEKEVFPAIAADARLFAMELEGYWMDVGQPKDYLTGLGLHLESLRRHKPAELAEGAHIKGNVIIDASATIGEGCVIGPNVAIGIGCVIGDGVRISNSVLLHRVKVKNYARVNDAIVGWGSSGTSLRAHALAGCAAAAAAAAAAAVPAAVKSRWPGGLLT